MARDEESMVDLYRRMVRIRAFEERVIELQGLGEICGAVHLSIGQEAAVVGVCAALRRDDFIAGTHRSHGHPIAKGAAVPPLMAELYGKATGVCKGKGGSMHLADFSVGSLGETAIVGASMPIATGAALSAVMRGTDQVSVAFFGDGGANTGAFHEALNLAAVWSLPVIFVCENNGYALTTAQRMAMRIENVADRAPAYGMPGTVVDGQDVLAVLEAAETAVERARAGHGPTLLEAKTYRFREHAEMGGLTMGDYRSQDEVAAWMTRDPIPAFRSVVVAGGTDPLVLDTVDRQVGADIDDAVAFARDSPYPPTADAFSDMWTDEVAR